MVLYQVALPKPTSSPQYQMWRCQHASPASSQPQHQAATATVKARPWLPLSQPLLWQGTEDQALSEDSCFKGLSPTWKVMLLSDGSVTRHLQLLTGTQVQVDCLEMVNVGVEPQDLPPAAAAINGPRVQRTILLRTGAQSTSTTTSSASQGQTIAAQGTAPSANGQTLNGHGNASKPPAASSSTSGNGVSAAGVPLVYAVSWWNAATVDSYLADRSKPIWVSLSQGHVELYREVQVVMHGHSPELEQLLGCPGPFWGRQYLFWHKGAPLTCIYEVFSPRLEQYLGPSIARQDEQ